MGRPLTLIALAVVALSIGAGAFWLIQDQDPVPADARYDIQAEPTLAGRIVKAFEVDPDGWTDDEFTAVWRGKVSVWIANGPSDVGADLELILPNPKVVSVHWPQDDHRFDADRKAVWAAYATWRDQRRDRAALLAFGPARRSLAVDVPSTGSVLITGSSSTYTGTCWSPLVTLPSGSRP